MLLGAGKAVLARQQATLTLRFSLQNSAAQRSQQSTPAAVLTGLRFKTTKAAAAPAAAQKTAAKKPIAAQPKTKSAPTAQAEKAKKAPVKKTATKTTSTTVKKSASAKPASKNVRVKAKEQAAKGPSAAAKARLDREMERAKKAAALLKEKAKKAAVLAKEKEKKVKEKERKVARVEKAKALALKKKAVEEKKKIRVQSLRSRALEKARLQREKLRAQARRQRLRELSKKKKDKEAEKAKTYNKTLHGVVKNNLDASLAETIPTYPSQNTKFTAYGIFCKELFDKKEISKVMEGQKKWSQLPEAEQQRYILLAKQRDAETLKAIDRIINSTPGPTIIAANTARHRIRAAYKAAGKRCPRRYRPLVDSRAPKKPASAFLLFSSACHKAKDLDGVPTISVMHNRAKDSAAKWKIMTDEEKAPFVAEYKKHMAIYEKARAAYTGATA